MLMGSGELILRIGELLARGLKPPFQLRNLPVPGSQIVRRPGKLGLKVVLLLRRPGLKLGLLAREPLPLGVQVGEIRLSGGLRLARLPETPLGLGELRSPGRQRLGRLGERLADFRLLASRLLCLAAPFGRFLGLRQNILLAGCDLAPHRRQALLRLLQLVLKLRKALRQSRDVAIELDGALLVGPQVLLSGGGLGLDLGPGLRELRQLLLLRLKVLKHGRVLRLRLLPRLGDLRELLLHGLERLLHGCKLRLKLVAGLIGPRKLLLHSRCRLLQGRELGLRLLPRLGDLGQLLLRA